jgi:hypothetical protein
MLQEAEVLKRVFVTSLPDNSYLNRKPLCDRIFGKIIKGKIIFVTRGGVTVMILP